MRNLRHWARFALAGVVLALSAVTLVAAPAVAMAESGGTSSSSTDCGGMPYNGGPCG
ncbi:hypothetical protein [Nonomuraea zeae]|uniref:hypothetical protein n=1 Tax=Nonomuraea zeae TaxID=1642303 RepID=UPI0014786960|nr:hypothetical protein [Nonomuraea zeae]